MRIKTAMKRKQLELLLKDLQTDLKFWSIYRSKTKSARIPKVVPFGSFKASTSAAKAKLFSHFFPSVFLKTDSHKVETSTTFATQDDKLYPRKC